jgi:hypothetical protein
VGYVFVRGLRAARIGRLLTRIARVSARIYMALDGAPHTRSVPPRFGDEAAPVSAHWILYAR